MNKQILAYDNRDDRREVVYLLEQMPPQLRVRWLWWCCRNTPGKMQMAPPPDHRGDVMEVYCDFWSLCNQLNLDADKALAKLTDMARKFVPARFRSTRIHRTS